MRLKGIVGSVWYFRDYEFYGDWELNVLRKWWDMRGKVEVVIDKKGFRLFICIFVFF